MLVHKLRLFTVPHRFIRWLVHTSKCWVPQMWSLSPKKLVILWSITWSCHLLVPTIQENWKNLNGTLLFHLRFRWNWKYRQFDFFVKLDQRTLQGKMKREFWCGAWFYFGTWTVPWKVYQIYAFLIHTDMFMYVVWYLYINTSSIQLFPWYSII